MRRAPNRIDMIAALKRHGWTEVRQVKHGSLWRSPDGQHTFLVPRPQGEGRGNAALQNMLSHLKRAGGQSAELHATMTGQA